MYFGSFFNQGWVCPKCGRVYSPTTSMCHYCGDGNGKTITTTGTGGYTVPSQTARDTEVKK